MDLITEPWLPIVSRSGEKKKIALSALLDNNIVEVDYPRADFQGAAWQFLIGLLQCTVAPEDDEDWQECWVEGINTASWLRALKALSPAMQFGSQKPSFLQSFETLEGENSIIAGLLIDAPGGNTLKLNKDHFVKRHVTEQICPHCAVMALFAVQTNSPAGGAGYRVSLRGGGPLTTLVVPTDESRYPLWQKLWLNVLPQDTLPDPKDFPAIFPWLAPTKTSEKAGNKVTPENAHLLQAYWGMPGRIELDFERTRAGICDLCGEQHTALLIEMRTKNYGVHYDNWLHPLSPYRQALKDNGAPRLALKGQPGGLGYKDWLGLVLECEDKFNRTYPAQVVRSFAGRRQGRLPSVGLWCFAWDMDNAKARCWYQHRVPLIHSAHGSLFKGVVQQVISLASAALQLLRQKLKEAWFETPAEAKVDFSMTDIAFWQETEPAFRQLLAALITDPERQSSLTCQAIRQWENDLHAYLHKAFIREALTDYDCPDDILLRKLKAHHKLEREYQKHKQRKILLALADEKEKGNV